MRRRVLTGIWPVDLLIVLLVLGSIYTLAELVYSAAFKDYTVHQPHPTPLCPSAARDISRFGAQIGRTCLTSTSKCKVTVTSLCTEVGPSPRDVK